MTQGLKNETSANALIIFIKNPQLGKVKTRLAKTVGDAAALEIYLQLTAITRQCVLQLNSVKTYVFYSDFVAENDDWSNDIFEKRVQSGADLGERMHRAFAEVLTQHPRACIIGSDCPTLTPALLEQAFDALENHDLVVGPSTDGGYYLLGIRRKTTAKAVNPPAFLFENMAWSTESVLPETRRRAAEHGYALTQIAPLTDIDEYADWQNFVQNATPQ